MNNTSDKERITLSRAEADAMMESGERVHTFITPSAGVLLGCDVDRAEVLDAADAGLVELAGEVATKMKHGIVWHDGRRCVFCATRETP